MWQTLFWKTAVGTIVCWNYCLGSAALLVLSLKIETGIFQKHRGDCQKNVKMCILVYVVASYLQVKLRIRPINLGMIKGTAGLLSFIPGHEEHETKDNF